MFFTMQPPALPDMQGELVEPEDLHHQGQPEENLQGQLERAGPRNHTKKQMRKHIRMQTRLGKLLRGEAKDANLHLIYNSLVTVAGIVALSFVKTDSTKKIMILALAGIQVTGLVNGALGIWALMEK
jgi:hypothetical protein